ncbi:putative stress-responsive transcriptional regulator [Renibacterium salmoninarum ATCC 33209]|uniref:Putative stress-responsive transcriptional regulator n=1 Tax=Renibacterium salmoninarum (strain ATCC 33209 / DSM 20767 / JCM 11484 / NBRC 15589 / NCIMB 2235) TaxID=288705 RepID=A9WNJ4_RENSM|nr:PspC domain-containing protein [Renibacterium salmoninarum]ABY22716.1 putative stress-responsive transcriptional regulator [Renibacterium salmoninarum ATCC 33209]
MNSIYKALRNQPLRRGPQRWIGGVLGGVAALTKIDVAWMRIGFLLLCLLPGPAFVLYAALWLLVPDQNQTIVTEQLLNKRRA